MPRPRRRTPRPRDTGDLRVLTKDQKSELCEGFSMIMLPRGQDSYFKSEDERRLAWEIHGEEIVASWSAPRQRPRGWWLYELGEPVPYCLSDQHERLAELGELAEAEKLKPLDDWDED